MEKNEKINKLIHQKEQIDIFITYLNNLPILSTIDKVMCRQ